MGVFTIVGAPEVRGAVLPGRGEVALATGLSSRYRCFTPATSMLILRQDELLDLLTPLQLIEAVEGALRAREAGRASMPKRLHLDWNGNTLLAMPAVGECALGTKLASVVPGNAERGLPVTSGVMLLNDGETGTPIALMNAAGLTAVRTGAVGGLGVKYMTGEMVSSVGIVGCGVQGAWQAIFACALRPIRDVFAVGRSARSFETFAATIRRRVAHVRVSLC